MAGKRVLFERRTEPRSQVSRKGELLADVTGAPGRNCVTGALGINVTASNRVYWHSKLFTAGVPVTGPVNLPVMLQCTHTRGVLGWLLDRVAEGWVRVRSAFGDG